MTPALKLEVDALAGTCDLLRERIAELEARVEALEVAPAATRTLSTIPASIRRRACERRQAAAAKRGKP